MIENNERIQSMCSNILEQVQIIKNDFATNGETHCNYILEKLSKAQWDLNVLIKMAENKKEEVEKKEE
ncbi:MAG: hypothetical protein IKC22_00565 [Bacilli bacterium]|nr:hypothetical protein [bacterium]MBR2890874.1 hypothetical protein [Bacilli bacterium]